MSKTLYTTAAKAIEVAKKNSLKRKQRTGKQLYALCLEKIAEMVELGVVSIYVPMNEDQHYWGFEIAKQLLEEGGFVVKLEEDEESETPDLVISIEHLK